MATPKIITYALDQTTGQPVYIRKAANGLACNCKCEVCEQPVEAIQGESNRWHFRHAQYTDCDGSQETAIHKLAKKIVIENSQMVIPNGILSYSNPKEEQPFCSIRPDVTAFSNEAQVFIEILVTHPVEEKTELFYLNGKHRSLEINLRNISYEITPNELTEIILHDAERKRKIYWEDQTEKEDTKGSAWQNIAILAAIIAIFSFAISKIMKRKKRSSKR